MNIDLIIDRPREGISWEEKENKRSRQVWLDGWCQKPERVAVDKRILMSADKR